MVQELLEGGTLAAAMHAHSRSSQPQHALAEDAPSNPLAPELLPLDQVFRVCAEVAEALAHLAEHGLVHR